MASCASPSFVYTLHRRSNRLENKLKSLNFENIQHNSDINKRIVARINKIESRFIKLIGIHNDTNNHVYFELGKWPKTAPIISEIDIGDSTETIIIVAWYFLFVNMEEN